MGIGRARPHPPEHSPPHQHPVSPELLGSQTVTGVMGTRGIRGAIGTRSYHRYQGCLGVTPLRARGVLVHPRAPGVPTSG